jgi:DNA-binding MarR family transcriptional regulator
MRPVVVDHRFSADELGRLIGIVSDVTRDRGCAPAEAITYIGDAVAGQRPPRSIGGFAARLRTLRARRNELVGAELMRDPAWDILLDLVAAREEQRTVSTKALCHGAGVPLSTTLRYLGRLEDRRLVRRQPHPHDQRQTLVTLHPDRAPEVEAIVAMFRDEL